MKKTALVIMAAGIGSRFGKGIKQLAPVGPKGEIIMDYSPRLQRLLMHSRRSMIFREISRNRQTVPSHGEPDMPYWQQRKSFPSHSLLSMQMTTMEKKPT